MTLKWGQSSVSPGDSASYLVAAEFPLVDPHSVDNLSFQICAWLQCPDFPVCLGPSPVLASHTRVDSFALVADGVNASATVFGGATAGIGLPIDPLLVNATGWSAADAGAAQPGDTKRASVESMPGYGASQSAMLLGAQVIATAPLYGG